jgi:hypothetical protein
MKSSPMKFLPPEVIGLFCCIAKESPPDFTSDLKREPDQRLRDDPQAIAQLRAALGLARTTDKELVSGQGARLEASTP